ncbi:hypothetical protein SH449x_000022 [Pirellulaceae bacterium SH449]
MRFKSCLLIPLFLWVSICFGSDQYFPDIHAQSSNGEWRVEAVSPDNRRKGSRGWQKDFVYSLHREGKKIWERKQAEQSVREDSPVGISVSDDGWVAIYTGGDQLLFVDVNGQNRGRVPSVKINLTDKERSEFKVWTIEGMSWSPFSIWRFVNFDSRTLFVVYTWWGGGIVFDPVTGDSVRIIPTIEASIRKYQIEYCRTLLENSNADILWDDVDQEVLVAALLAGQLGMKETIRDLRRLQHSEYSDRSGGVLGLEMEHGAVDPFFTRQFTLRQICHLSLRRLGESPRALHVHEFLLVGTDNYFNPPAQEDREKMLDFVKSGMSPEEVLDILGSPDFIYYPEWSYDLDGKSPATAKISWKNGKVTDVSLSEPLWLQGKKRDRLIIYGF